MADLTPIWIGAALLTTTQRAFITAALKSLFLPTLDMAGEALRESVGDSIARWRGRNAAATLELAGTKILEQGLDGVESRHLRTSLALQLLEKASLEDDHIIQEMWANLMVAAVKGGQGADDVTIDTLHVNALHHMNRVDCEALRSLIDLSCSEFMSEEGDWSILVTPVEPDSLKEVHPHILLSMEKLIHLGCARSEISDIELGPLRTLGPSEDRKRLTDSLVRSVSPTVIGIELYVAASGEWPDALREGNRIP